MTQTQAASGAVSLPLDAVADIRGVAELQQRLWDVLAQGHPVTIEAGAVERVDAAVLQLLLAFRRAAAEVGVGVHWGGVSSDFTQAARVCGLEQDLGLSAGG